MFGKTKKKERQPDPPVPTSFKGYTGLTLNGEVTILLKESRKGAATIEIVGSSQYQSPVHMVVGDTLAVKVEL
jgi:hypothetical protein